MQVTGIKEGEQTAISEGEPGLKTEEFEELETDHVNLNGSKKTDWPKVEGETEVYGIRFIKDPG
jgi:hypothetical protein